MRKYTSSFSVFLILAKNYFRDKIKIEENKKVEKLEAKNENKNMKITSSAFKNEGVIPDKYTCDGEDINPELNFVDIPEDTVGLVLIVDDPDSPTKTWVHWIVFNIDPEVRKIEEDSVPEGAKLGVTNFGKPGYGGPCPSQGKHRYFFKLYALDKSLDLSEGVDKHALEEAMEGHVLESAELMGMYERK